MKRRKEEVDVRRRALCSSRDLSWINRVSRSVGTGGLRCDLDGVKMNSLGRVLEAEEDGR